VLLEPIEFIIIEIRSTYSHTEQAMTALHKWSAQSAVKFTVRFEVAERRNLLQTLPSSPPCQILRETRPILGQPQLASSALEQTNRLQVTPKMAIPDQGRNNDGADPAQATM
jgi:hypothetical protein